MAEPKPHPKRRLRRTLLWAGGAFVAILLLLALLPVFIGWGLFHGVVRDAIGASFNGEVDVKGLSVSWFGSQTIEELSITGPQDDAHARLAIRLERGLLPLVFGSNDYGTLHLGGTIDGVRYMDGTTSLQTLLKEKEETEPLDMKVRIVSDGIDVSLRDPATDETVAVRSLAGEVLFDPTGMTTIGIKGETSASGQIGSLGATGSIERLFDETGAIDVRNAAFDLGVEVTQLPVAVIDGLLGLDGRLTALAGDVMDEAAIVFKGDFEDGIAEFHAASTQLDVDSAVALAGGAAVIDEARPALIALRLPAASVALLMRAGGEPPAISIEEGGAVAATLRITRANIPLPAGAEAPFDLSGGTIAASLDTSNLPLQVRSGEFIETIEVSSLTASIDSPDLTRSLTLALNGAARTGGENDTTVAANLVFAEPVSADGTITIDPASIQGDLQARNLPTSLAQAVLGDDSPIVLARDLGPRADLTANFSSGETRAIHATLAAERAALDLRATVAESGAIAGESLTFDLDLTPELLAAISPAPLAAPARLSVNLTGFTVPAREDGQPFSLAALGMAGSFTLGGDALVSNASNETSAEPLRIESAAFTIESSRLSDAVSISGAALVEGADFEITQVISDLFAPDGSLQLLDATPVGTIHVRGVTSDHLAAMAPGLAPGLVPLLVGGVEMLVNTSAAEKNALIADVVINGEAISSALRAQRIEGDVILSALRADAALSSETVRTWQEGSDDPIEASAGEVTLELASPATLLRRTESGYELALDAVVLAVKSPEVTIAKAPALAQPIALRGFAANIDAALGEAPRIAVAGSTVLRAQRRTGARDGDSGRRIASASFSMDMPLATEPALDAEPAAETPPAYPDFDLSLTEINVGLVEEVLAREAGSLAKFLGPSGAMTIDLDPTAAGFQATLIPAFPYVSGTFHAVRDDATLAIDAADAMVVLSAQALGEYLTAVPETSAAEGAPAAAPPPATITVAKDVPLRVDLKSLTIPADILSGAPLSTTAAAIDLVVAIREPLALSRTIGASPPETAQFDELSVTVTGDDLDAGIAIALNGLLRSPPGEAPPPEAGANEEPAPAAGRSRIDIAATLSDLVNDEMTLDVANAILTAEVRARRVPAWIADAAARTDSLLGDAFGATITVEASAEDFSPESGTLTANIGGANNSRLRAKLTGRDGGYAAERGDPITGALTLSPELRNRLLHGIHPIFSDVRALNEQVRFKVRNAYIPAASNSPLPNPGAGEAQGVRENDPAASGERSAASDPQSSIANQQSAIDLSHLSGVIELTIGPAEFTAGSEFLRILSFVAAAQGGQLPSPPGGEAGGEGEQPQGPAEKIIEGYIGPLDGSPIIIKIDRGRLTYENFIIHLEREEVEAPRQPRAPGAPGERRRDRQATEGEGSEAAPPPSPPGRGAGGEGDQPQPPAAPAQPADYAHHLLFSGDIDLVNRRVNRIVGAYPLSDLIANVRGSAPADLLGLNIANVGVRFFGDLYDAGGNPLDLQMEIDFELKVEDLFEEGLRRTPGEDAPALQRLLEEIFK